MGFSLTWCAVREEKAERLLEQLKLSPTGETEDIPESRISMARLATGWRVIWYNEYGCPFLRPEDLRDLSIGMDVLLCLVEEHVMASSSEMWSNGHRKWWISHEGENGPKGISTDGELPEPFHSIRKEMEQLQLGAGGAEADVDYMFDIPLNVAESVVGFKHDNESAHLVDQHFVVLTRTVPAGGLLRRLFGK